MATTDGHSPAEHRQVWEQWNRENLTDLSVFIPSEAGLTIDSRQRKTPTFRITHLRGSKHVVQHGQFASTDHQDRIFLTLMTQGQGFFYSESFSSPFTAGDVLIYRIGQPYMLAFVNDMEQFLIELKPSHRLYPVLADTVGLPTQLSSEVSTAFTHHVLEAFGQYIDSRVDQVIERQLDALVDELGASGLSMFERARSLFLFRCAEPDFSVSAAAMELAMSERQLHRVFTKFGEKPSSLLRRMRIALAIDKLKSTDLALAHVADQSGFSSARAMAQAFKQEVQQTPSSFRR